MFLLLQMAQFNHLVKTQYLLGPLRSWPSVATPLRTSLGPYPQTTLPSNTQGHCCLTLIPGSHTIFFFIDFSRLPQSMHSQTPLHSPVLFFQIASKVYGHLLFINHLPSPHMHICKRLNYIIILKSLFISLQNSDRQVVSVKYSEMNE